MSLACVYGRTCKFWIKDHKTGQKRRCRRGVVFRGFCTIHFNMKQKERRQKG